MTSTWFITGTSSGFGRELTERLLERGDRVAATLRRPERLDDLVSRYGERLWVRELDVTDTGRLREVADALLADLEHDVLEMRVGITADLYRTYLESPEKALRELNAKTGG